jgi:hypothetical protein
MKQVNVIVESYQDKDGNVTYCVRKPGDNSQWIADKICTNPAELADYFGNIF